MPDTPNESLMNLFGATDMTRDYYATAKAALERAIEITPNVDVYAYFLTIVCFHSQLIPER